jgi:hypothetical protein
MSDIWGIIGSNYLTVGGSVHTAGKYVDVDPALYEGRWEGKYANNKSFSLQVSSIRGFRAKVRYQSGSTVQFRDVLIKNSSFRVGDTKFMLTKENTAQINTVATNPVTGQSTLETAFAHRK